MHNSSNVLNETMHLVDVKLFSCKNNSFRTLLLVVRMDIISPIGDAILLPATLNTLKLRLDRELQSTCRFSICKSQFSNASVDIFVNLGNTLANM